MVPVVVLLWARVDTHSLVQLIVAANDTVAPHDTSSKLAQYGPLLVAATGLLVALGQFLATRGKNRTDQASVVDTTTNTALKGLEAYADRLEKERDAWQERAEKAEERADSLEAINDELRAKLPPRKRAQ